MSNIPIYIYILNYCGRLHRSDRLNLNKFNTFNLLLCLIRFKEFQYTKNSMTQQFALDSESMQQIHQFVTENT